MHAPPVELITWAQLVEEHGRRAPAVVRERELLRVVRGCYAPPGTDVTTPEARARAAGLLLPKAARLADRFLLSLFGADVMPLGVPVVEAVVARGAVVPRRDWSRIRETHLPSRDCQVIRQWDVPMLRLARTVVDLLRALPLGDGVAVADATLHEGIVTVDELADELPHHAGLRGVRRAVQGVGLVDARAESLPESRVRVALVLDGLEPVPQYVVQDARGRFLGRVDLALPQHRIAIEYDGREVHSRREVFTRDRQRQNDLVAAGWTVLRFTADDLRHPERIVAAVRAAIARAAA